MVKTIKNPLVSLGVLKVPGTPRSGEPPNSSIFTFKCGKVVFGGEGGSRNIPRRYVYKGLSTPGEKMLPFHHNEVKLLK